MIAYKNFLQKPILWIVVIFLSSSIFRIFFLDLIEFKYDEAYTVFEITEFYIHPTLMQVGPPQSTGVFNFPLFNYLIIFLSFVSREPQFLSFCIALINSIAIVFFYVYTRKYYSNFTAILASLTLAFSPWNILLSRKIWIPDIILPLLIVFFYFLHKLLLDKNNKSIFPIFIIMALLIQLHASLVFFVFATILLFITFKINVNLKNAFFGFCVGIIPGVPYFIRQLTSDPFCIDCIAFVNYQKIPKPFDLFTFIRPFQIINGSRFYVMLGNSYRDFLNSFQILNVLNIVFIFESFLFIAGIIFIIKFKHEYLFLLFYLITIPFLFFFSKTPSFMQYFIIITPITALIFALSLNFLFNLTKNSILIIIPTLLITLFLSSNIIFQICFNKFLSDKKEVKGDYGVVFSKTKELVENETSQYILLPYYNELKNYSYMFATKPDLINGYIGYFFMQKNEINPSINEFKKSLEINPKNTFSRSNLTYIYILIKQYDLARKELSILSKDDSTTSAKLNKLMEEAINNQPN